MQIHRWYQCYVCACDVGSPPDLHGLVLRLQVVYVGERVVDHNPAFKLYLVTRTANPSLTPDVEPLLTVTNFSITRSGLESRYMQ